MSGSPERGLGGTGNTALEPSSPPGHRPPRGLSQSLIPAGSQAVARGRRAHPRGVRGLSAHNGGLRTMAVHARRRSTHNGGLHTTVVCTQRWFGHQLVDPWPLTSVCSPVLSLRGGVGRSAGESQAGRGRKGAEGRAKETGMTELSKGQVSERTSLFTCYFARTVVNEVRWTAAHTRGLCVPALEAASPDQVWGKPELGSPRGRARTPAPGPSASSGSLSTRCPGSEQLSAGPSRRRG